MTLTLSPETQAELEAVAALRGLPPEDTLALVLAEARAVWEHELQDAYAGVLRGEADFAAGRSLSLEEWTASMDATLEAKRRQAKALQEAKSQEKATL